MKENGYWKDEELSNRDRHQIKFINLGAQDSWFSGTFAMGDGKACVQTLLAYGADVIMPVAGPQTIDTVQEIKNQKSNCIVVGVDTPQEDSDMNDNSVYTDKSGNKYANKIIKFSAQKNITGITEQILDLAYSESPYYEVNNGNWVKHAKDSAPYDESKVMVGSYGFLTIGNVDNDGVKSSGNSDSHLINLINFITNESKTKYSEIIELLKDGTLLPSPDHTGDPISILDDLGSEEHSEHMV
jgi:basic membrane lipoprotein Med (substrate-binding protein (PBP1-ABC) superfamily)